MPLNCWWLCFKHFVIVHCVLHWRVCVVCYVVVCVLWFVNVGILHWRVCVVCYVVVCILWFVNVGGCKPAALPSLQEMYPVSPHFHSVTNCLLIELFQNKIEMFPSQILSSITLLSITVNIDSLTCHKIVQQSVVRWGGIVVTSSLAVLSHGKWIISILLPFAF